MRNKLPPEDARTSKLPRISAHSALAAIDTRQIYPVFQPIFDVETGSPFAQEALMRCGIADIASPVMLIGLAKDEGVLGRLGREMRRTTFNACKTGRLFINIDPDEFDDEWLARTDDPMFGHAADVYMEITEAAPIAKYRFCRSMITELRERGIKLAVDDFGAGYSNVMSIVELQPEIVKLDRALVMGATVGSRQHTLMRSLVSLCADQGARVIAEGIETATELEAVVAAGVTLAQGYYFARPSRDPLAFTT